MDEKQKKTLANGVRNHISEEEKFRPLFNYLLDFISSIESSARADERKKIKDILLSDESIHHSHGDQEGSWIIGDYIDRLDVSKLLEETL